MIETYLSTFTGIGGFELGIMQAYESICNQRRLNNKKEPTKTNGNKGGTNVLSQVSNPPLCIGYSEIDKYAIQIYQKHFPNHKNYGDITTIQTKDLPNFDMLVGGFPCQSFSIAGKREGFNDPRGRHFYEIARILQDKKPRLLFLENVKGLLSAGFKGSDGKVIKETAGIICWLIISTLDELGYDLQWQVLNSKNHGVPQNRERVFIIGHFRGTSRPQVFPFGGEDRENVSESGEEQERGSWVSTLDARYGERWSSETYVRTDKQNTRPEGDKSDSPNSIRRTSYTDGARVRRLTPTECERLQGFPDGWTEGVSDTQRYKTLGNAVTVNVIKDIMVKLNIN